MRWYVLVVVGVIGLTGCNTGLRNGPPPTGAEVTGKVRLGTTPLGGGTVRLVSATDESRSAVGSIQADGTYTVKNAPLGKVVIAVETESARPFDPAFQRGGGGPPAGVATPNLKYVRIPTRYAQAKNSGLTLEVTGGVQQHDLILR
jgi:hypothetical protein